MEGTDPFANMPGGLKDAILKLIKDQVETQVKEQVATQMVKVQEEMKALQGLLEDLKKTPPPSTSNPRPQRTERP